MQIREILKSKPGSILELSDILPKQAVAVASGQTVDGLIRNYFPSYYSSPKLKTELVSRILKINSLERAVDLRPGFFALPILPKVATAGSPNVRSILAIFPAAQVPATANFGQANASVSKLLSVTTEAANTGIHVWLDSKSAERLLGNDVFKGISEIQSAPMEILFADYGHWGPQPLPVQNVLNDVEREMLSSESKSSVLHQSYLFIFDTGWPTPAEKSTSISQLNVIYDYVWRNAFQQAKPYSPRAVEPNDNPPFNAVTVLRLHHHFRKTKKFGIKEWRSMSFLFRSPSNRVLAVF